MRFFHNIKRPQWPLVDHRSRNGLDNQDTNIRDGSGGANQRDNAKSSNHSSVTGVCYHRRDKGWRASLMHNGELYQKFFPGPHDNTSEAFHAACEWRATEAEKWATEMAAARPECRPMDVVFFVCEPLSSLPRPTNGCPLLRQALRLGSER